MTEKKEKMYVLFTSGQMEQMQQQNEAILKAVKNQTASNMILGILAVVAIAAVILFFFYGLTFFNENNILSRFILAMELIASK